MAKDTDVEENQETDKQVRVDAGLGSGVLLCINLAENN